MELRRIDGLALSYHTVQQGVCAVLEKGGFFGSREGMERLVERLMVLKGPKMSLVGTDSQGYCVVPDKAQGLSVRRRLWPRGDRVFDQSNGGAREVERWIGGLEVQGRNLGPSAENHGGIKGNWRGEVN